MELSPTKDEVWTALSSTEEQRRILKVVEDILDNDYTKPTIEQAVNRAIRYIREIDNDSSSDWGKAPNRTVDYRAIWKRMPSHRNCPLVIRRSESNARYVGLYCKKHNKLLQWVNSYQIYWLMRPTNSGVTNETDDNGEYL